MLDLNSLNERLTVEDVKLIMEILGADYVNETDTDIKYKTICHGGNKHKLYFYKESMTFYCYSECGRIGSILDLAKKIKEFDNVYDAGEWICKQLGMSIFKEGSFGNEFINAPRIELITDNTNPMILNMSPAFVLKVSFLLLLFIII